uniref:Complex1_LYR_dom domain-containing protein n=1 Tax=Macrostomum lignano TaxID=282301 RepID=A0A1I8F336_9PLAT
SAASLSSQRQRVLSLYRQILRLARQWPGRPGVADPATEAAYIRTEAGTLPCQTRAVIESHIAEAESRINLALHYNIPYPRMPNLPPGCLATPGQPKRRTARGMDDALPAYMKSYKSGYAPKINKKEYKQAHIALLAFQSQSGQTHQPDEAANWEAVDERLLHVEHGGLLLAGGGGRVSGLDSAAPRLQQGRLDLRGRYKDAAGTRDLLDAGEGAAGPNMSAVGQTEKLLLVEPPMQSKSLGSRHQQQQYQRSQQYAHYNYSDQPRTARPVQQEFIVLPTLNCLQNRLKLACTKNVWFSRKLLRSAPKNLRHRYCCKHWWSRQMTHNGRLDLSQQLWCHRGPDGLASLAVDQRLLLPACCTSEAIDGRDCSRLNDWTVAGAGCCSGMGSCSTARTRGVDLAGSDTEAVSRLLHQCLSLDELLVALGWPAEGRTAFFYYASKILVSADGRTPRLVVRGARPIASGDDSWAWTEVPACGVFSLSLAPPSESTAPPVLMLHPYDLYSDDGNEAMTPSLCGPPGESEQSKLAFDASLLTAEAVRRQPDAVAAGRGRRGATAAAAARRPALASPPRSTPSSDAVRLRRLSSPALLLAVSAAGGY